LRMETDRKGRWNDEEDRSGEEEGRCSKKRRGAGRKCCEGDEKRRERITEVKGGKGLKKEYGKKSRIGEKGGFEDEEDGGGRNRKWKGEKYGKKRRMGEKGGFLDEEDWGKRVI
jgi:hypothetical protein